MVLTSSQRDLRLGTACVEFALVSPLLLTMLLGIWEVGRMIEVQQILNNAAREGGRQATTGQMSNASVQTIVYTYLNNAGIQVTDGSGNPLTGVSVTIANITETGVDASAANKLDHFTITVTVPFGLVRWAALNHFMSANASMTATEDWYSLKNQPLSVSTTIPITPQ